MKERKEEREGGIEEDRADKHKSDFLKRGSRKVKEIFLKKAAENQQRE